MDFLKHFYRVGPHEVARDDLPSDPTELARFIEASRKAIEPWLSAVFQAEHLNLLVGNGLSIALAQIAGVAPATMSKVSFGTKFDAVLDDHAAASAKRLHRGAPNIEDQFRSALALLDGLTITSPREADLLEDAIEKQLSALLIKVLGVENAVHSLDPSIRIEARAALQSFLLSFASRAASRERLHIFTTNYDRTLEHGCDLAGLRVIDRFVGALSPRFRASRAEVDIHYNPPGIRGEPRYLEGVVRLTKLHGSLDWVFDQTENQIVRSGLPFGAASNHPALPGSPLHRVMIYPNPAKDVETLLFPYAELFRDFAAATCRPNAVLVTYGYGFGDDHVNRIIADMLTIPSTHLVVISYALDERTARFIDEARRAQVSILLGDHFADLRSIVHHYLPKPALDYITGRMAEIVRNRSH